MPATPLTDDVRLSPADDVPAEEARLTWYARPAGMAALLLITSLVALTATIVCPGYYELHELLQGLPLFPYMEIEVNALCRHPSSIRDDDR